MFWISGLFFVLGVLILAIIVTTLLQWKTKRRKYIRGPWVIPKNFEVPNTGVRGEIIRGPESWYKNPDPQNGGDTPNV